MSNLKENWGYLAAGAIATGLAVLVYREATKTSAPSEAAAAVNAPATTSSAAAPATVKKKARERGVPTGGGGAGTASASASVGGSKVAATPQRKSMGGGGGGASTPAGYKTPANAGTTRGSPNSMPYIYQPGGSSGAGTGGSGISKPKLKKSHSEPPTPDSNSSIAEEKFSAVAGDLEDAATEEMDDSGADASGDSPVRKVQRVEYDEDDTAANALVERAVSLFEEFFSVKEYKYRRKDLLVAIAPGRVNLIGEHTDYNDGFVLPMAIDKACVVVGRPNGINKYRFVTGNITDAKSADPVMMEFDAKTINEKTVPVQWHNYFRGVVAAYARDESKSGASGGVIPGFDAAVWGDVPLGGGLSSSAALEMATATFLDGILDVNTTKKEKALRCQWAEHEFANMPCGIMDQYISAHAESGRAVLLDCRSLEVRPVKLDNPSVTVLITNSNVKHALTGGEYAERRKQCESAVSVLKKKNPKITALRDATLMDLESCKSSLDATSYCRARHVISEDDRTLTGADALERGDYVTFGKLMCQSHESLRADFQVSCKELDVLVTIATECKGVYGSRMTGGGFGGCTVTLVRTADAQRVASIIQTEYKKRLGLTATTITSRACDGARLIKLG